MVGKPHYDLEIICKTKRTQSQVRIYKDGNLVGHREGVSIKNNDQCYEVTIRKPKAEDLGMYQCLERSDSGKG